MTLYLHHIELSPFHTDYDETRQFSSEQQYVHTLNFELRKIVT